MRLSSLLDVEVFDEDGRSIGTVLDVRMVQRGPMLASFGAALQIESLVVGPGALGARLGYDRGPTKGPWPLRELFHALHRSTRTVPWDALRAVQPQRIDIAVPVSVLAFDDDLGERSRGSGPAGPSAGGRSFDAGLSLLDRQVIDVEGRMAGKVDDLELEFPADGRPPFVSAILTGPGALAHRIGGRPGVWIESIHARLQESDAEGPGTISFGAVQRITSAIELAVHRDDLQTMRFEAWVRDRIISRIPGAE
jgi:sporulation protein YlmC with PRC-barrel domain